MRMKCRKARAMDKPASSGEVRYLLVVACVLTTPEARSLFVLPEEMCWVATVVVGAVSQP